MARKCVFCGNKPIDENKEHIIPQWLIEYTGEKNRVFYLGPDYSGDKIGYRSFSASSFKFPACSQCNSNYAELEGKVKHTVINLIDNNLINSNEIPSLLDWFDKVRIGLWIAYQMLDKNPFNVEPNYYINNRVGKTDRCLYIFKASDDSNGVSFHGFQNPLFQLFPIAYIFRIKNLVFLNISTDFLTIRRLGFPFPVKVFFGEEQGQIGINDFLPGLERILSPIIKNGVLNYDYVFYQTVFDKYLFDKQFINNSYVKAHSLKQGQSYILNENDNNFSWLIESQEILLKFKKEKTIDELLEIVGKYFDKIYDNHIKQINLDEVSPEKRAGYRQNINFYRALTKKTKMYEKYAFFLFLKEKT